MMSEANAGGDGSGQVKYNQKNAGVKRILQEVKDMQADPSPDFIAFPLEDNIFEWQFAIRGPQDSEFEGGIYHGRIQLPPEYPFKPPAFMLLTPNGRFETQTKICLSISNYHPEHWLPSWSIRTALVALIAFMPTNPDGALGSLDYNKEERRALAVESRESPPNYGNADRQRLMDEIHQYLLSKTPSVSELPAESNINQSTTATVGAQNSPDDNTTAAVEELPNPEAEETIVEDRRELHLDAAAGPVRVRFSAGVSLQRTQPVETNQQNRRRIARGQKTMDDRLLTWAAVGLTVAIVALVVKKCLKSYGIEV